MKKQIVQQIADQLVSYGYTVYLASNGEYGFYTNGVRVVSFGGQWRFCVDFSGNYQAATAQAARSVGTGWGIAKEVTSITQEQADAFINACAPAWATLRNSVTYTTPEQYLKKYASSGYAKYEPAQVA